MKVLIGAGCFIGASIVANAITMATYGRTIYGSASNKNNNNSHHKGMDLNNEANQRFMDQVNLENHLRNSGF